MPRLCLALLSVATVAAARTDRPARSPAGPSSAQRLAEPLDPADVTATEVHEAVQALQSAMPARALELARAIRERADPKCRAAETARLVEAVSLARMRRARELYGALERLVERGPDLGTYTTFLRAGVTSALGGCEAAETLAESLSDASTYAPLAWSRVANCWTRRKAIEAAERAADRLEQYADSSGRKAMALLTRARIHEAAGRRRKARDAYREALIQFPLTNAGRTANERLEELKRAGMRVEPLAPQELLPRAHVERSMRHSRSARRLFSTIIASSHGRRHADLRHAAELGIVELDLVDRRYRRALGRIERVLSGDPDDELAAQALYLRGDILSRLGRVRDSLAAYQLAVHDHPETAYAAEAALSAARLAYNTRDMALARSLAEWMVERDAPGESVATVSGDGAARVGDASLGMRDHALWLLAWIERRSGGVPALMDSYLAQIDATGRLADAALYWRARLALDAGHLADAEVFTDLLVQRKPTSFYALAASDLVARQNPGCSARIAVPQVARHGPAPAPAPAGEPRDLLGAVVLLEHGLESEARQIVRLLPGTALSGADKLAAAWIYGRCGDVHRAALLTRTLADGAEQLDPTLLSLAFPRPFSDIVDEAAAEHGVPVALIYAVIRQESAFDPRAISPRYARGLMQMIRPTAKRMAAEAELKRFRQAQLYDPEISIRLGTTYLASLLEQFDGNLAATVASYHAGEQNVSRWLKSRGHMNADEFIEEIPFATTREYVKKVLSAYGLYTLLYRDETREAMPLEIAAFMPAPKTALR